MKHTILLLISVLFSLQLQAEEDYITNVSKSLNCLHVFTVENVYSNLSNDQKQTRLNEQFSTEKTVLVHKGYQIELWLLDDSTNKLRFVECFNMNDLELKKYSKVTVDKPKKNPFFVYIGGQLYAADQTASLFIASRSGLYLFNNKWDVAVPINLGKFNEDTFFDFGVNCRYYYTKTKAGIVPYLGAGLALSSFTPKRGTATTTTFFPLSVGINWMIGPGSLDIGMQSHKVQKVLITLGYTFRPTFKKRKLR